MVQMAVNIQQKSVWQQLEYIMPRFFLLVLVLVSLFGSRSTELRTFSLIFISILFEALPFMLLGSLAGGFIEEFVPRDKLTELMPSGSKKAVFLSALVGFIFPVCECAIVPVVRRLLRKGVPFSAAVAYLLAGPIVNPLVAASTAVAYFYNWKMVALRLGLGYLAAVSVGLIVNFLTSENNRLAHDSRSCQAGCSCGHDHEHEHDYEHDHDHTHNHDSLCQTGCSCGHDHAHDPKSSAGDLDGGLAAPQMPNSHKRPQLIARIHQALIHGGQDFLEVACFLVAGAFFAAAAQTFVNRQLITQVMSENWLAIIIMMALAVALNLCSEADAFVAASFRHMVGVPGQLGFLVLGPMFDLKLFFMYFSIFSRRTAIILAISTILTVYLLVWLTSFLIGGMSV